MYWLTLCQFPIGVAHLDLDPDFILWGLREVAAAVEFVDVEDPRQASTLARS